MKAAVADIRAVLVRAAEFTNWVFVEIETDGGVVGTGEASLSGKERLIAEQIELARPRLLGQDLFDLEPQLLFDRRANTPMLLPTLSSAVDQAVWDLKAQLMEVPLWQLLGGRNGSIPLYANINRASLDRSPQAMAKLARRAIDDGFAGVKCAPLDGIERQGQDPDEQERLLVQAIERVRAIRNAIGPEPQLMVDCHWRLSPSLAHELVERLSPLQLGWLEDPFPEEATEDWKSLRRHTDVPLAGGERATSLDQIIGAIATGQYDIACPDVRHIGGVEALWHAAHLIAAAGAKFAPHNPRGPVGTVASAHVTAASPELMYLEFPFGECDWRSKLVQGAESVVEGALVLPDSTGVGTRLDHSVVAQHPYQQRTAPREESKVDIW